MANLYQMQVWTGLTIHKFFYSAKCELPSRYPHSEALKYGIIIQYSNISLESGVKSIYCIYDQSIGLFHEILVKPI